MKSLVPWFCLIATASSQCVYAADGLDAYRQGHYDLAAVSLYATQGNDPVANYYLGLMRLYGYGQLKNNTIALRYFTKAAEKGYVPAQKLLANYYLTHQKPEEALAWFKKAANANEISSQMYCAAAYSVGYGVKKNIDTARRYYIDAAKNGNAIAQYALALQFLDSRDSRNKKMGLIWLTKSADKGNPKAQLLLAELYFRGGLIHTDAEKAKELGELAAKQNYLPAMVFLGGMARKQGDTRLSMEWFLQAAKAENSAAQFAVAELYLDEKSTYFDKKSAFLWMLKAAKNGSHEAQLALAKMYKEGTGVEVDEKLSAQWAESASKKTTQQSNNAEVEIAKWLSNDNSSKLVDSGYQLTGIYTAWQNSHALKESSYNIAPQMTKVTRQSLYQPIFTMVKPTEISINDYFDILAPMLNSKETTWSFPRYPLDTQIDALLRNDSLVLKHEPMTNYVERTTNYSDDNQPTPFNYFDEKTKGWAQLVNYQSVLTHLYSQAILGDSSSQFELGQLYQYGIGVAKNPQQAITYFQLAAMQQEVRAEYNLGVIYLEGQSNPVDYAKGIEWMTDAAFKGDAYAQYVLGNIYENGFKTQDGVEIIKPDHQQAMAMYYLSSSNNYGEAEYRLADFLVKEKKGNLSVAAKNNRNKLIKRLYEGAAKHGVAEASLPLSFYYAMENDPAKQRQAFAEATQAAKAGNAQAAMLLAIMYERGISVPADSIESMYWYQQAAVNPVSAFILGTYYSEGTGLTKDVEQGKRLLQQAADAGFSYANFNLAILQHASGQDFLAELDKARQSGNSKAGLLLADYYLLAANDPEKMKQAREIYQYFADKGDKEAQLKLGFLYERGLGGEANNELAAHWYALSAEQSQPIAQYLLAQLYQVGRIDKAPDYAQAKKWYQSALSSYSDAAVAQGFIYDTVDDDYKKAAENYELAAAKGNPVGEFNLGLLYEYGKGMPVNNEKAIDLYTKAANQGYAKAMTQLAGLYFRGLGTERNDEQALHWYQKAADAGDNNAMYQLGLFSETGVATTLDFAEALKFYQHSADLGNQKAKLALARMYQYGLGVTKDYQHAADIYKELATTDNAYAQYQLATFYLDGMLGERQLEQGNILLKQASENGSVQAQKRMQWLNAQQAPQVSFIDSVPLNKTPLIAGESAELMYFDALSEWNRGDETASRMILNKLMAQYPEYAPAKYTVEQLNQQKNAGVHDQSVALGTAQRP